MKPSVSPFPASLTCLGVLLLAGCGAPQPDQPPPANPCAVVTAPTGPTSTVTIGVDSSSAPWKLTVSPATAVVQRDTGSIEWVNDTPLEVAVMVQEGPRQPAGQGQPIVLRQPPARMSSGSALPHIGPPVKPAIALLAESGRPRARATANADPQAVCGLYKYSVVAFPSAGRAASWSGRAPGLKLDPPLYLVR